MSDAGVVRLLLFRVGTVVFAAEAERVREIFPGSRRLGFRGRLQWWRGS